MMAEGRPKPASVWLIAIVAIVGVLWSIGLENPALFKSTGGLMILGAAILFCGGCLYWMERRGR